MAKKYLKVGKRMYPLITVPAACILLQGCSAISAETLANKEATSAVAVVDVETQETTSEVVVVDVETQETTSEVVVVDVETQEPTEESTINKDESASEEISDDNICGYSLEVYKENYAYETGTWMYRDPNSSTHIFKNVSPDMYGFITVDQSLIDKYPDVDFSKVASVIFSVNGNIGSEDIRRYEINSDGYIVTSSNYKDGKTVPTYKEATEFKADDIIIGFSSLGCNEEEATSFDTSIQDSYWVRGTNGEAEVLEPTYTTETTDNSDDSDNSGNSGSSSNSSDSGESLEATMARLYAETGDPFYAPSPVVPEPGYTGWIGHYSYAGQTNGMAYYVNGSIAQGFVFTPDNLMTKDGFVFTGTDDDGRRWDWGHELTPGGGEDGRLLPDEVIDVQIY